MWWTMGAWVVGFFEPLKVLNYADPVGWNMDFFLV